jgi:flagellar basal body-associated protein FliL
MPTKTEAKPKTPDAAKGAPEKAADAPPSKAKVWILAAVLATAAGATLAVMAVPKAPEPKPVLEGPFVARLSKQDVQVNLAGENGKRYLVLGLNAEYFAYDESFVAARLGNAAAAGGSATPAVEDPLYTAMLKDLLVRMASRKTREHVEDPVQMEAFLGEIRTAVEPLLFPVCIGDSVVPQHPDTKSGLRVGESIMDSTMRGMLHDHALEVSAPTKTIRLDGGPVVTFTGEERDLKLTGEQGECLYVNVTGLNPDFVGKVPIGVAGRVRRIYREQLLMQ